MVNRNLIGRTPDDDDAVYGRDLTEPPEAPLESDPMANSTAMLGSEPSDTGEISPEEAGPAAGLAFLGMMVQGAEGLAAQFPGFIPMEITVWLQQAMQVLPLMIQKSQAQIAMSSPGMGMGMGMDPTGGMGGGGGVPPTAILGPPGSMSPSPAPSGPPRRQPPY